MSTKTPIVDANEKEVAAMVIASTLARDMEVLLHRMADTLALYDGGNQSRQRLAEYRALCERYGVKAIT